MKRRPDTTFDRLREIAARRWPLAAAVATVGLAAGGGVALGLPDQYRATATVLVAPLSGDELPGALEARLQVVGHEILSRARLLDLADRFGLYRALMSEDALLERLRRDIRVDPKEARTPDGRRLVTALAVGFRAADPATAAAVANAIASLYVSEDTRRRAGSAEALGAQLQEVKGRLDDLERRLGGPRAARSLSSGDASLTSLERVQIQLRMVSENRMRAMERRTTLLKDLAGADTGASADPDAAAARVTTLKQELRELRRKYTDRHPDVRRLVAEIAAAERQAAERRGAARPARSEDQGLQSLKEALQAVEEEIRVLRDEEAALRRQAEAYRARLEHAAASDAGPLPDDASRDYETTRALYATLLRRYEEARLAAEGDAGAAGFRVLDPAVPPTEPSAPQRTRLLLAALGCALGAGLAAAALAEQADTAFHSLDDLRAFARVPVLASIPTIATSADARRRGWRRRLAAAGVLLAAFAVAQGSYHLARNGGTAFAMLAPGRSS